MSENTSGRAIIVAAVLVSFSIIGASFFVADALTIAGLIAFPAIVLYLPGLLLGL